MVAGKSSAQTDYLDISGDVYSIAVQTDGRIIAGGGFDFPGGQGLCRMNPDGTLDATFTPTVDGAVMAVALQADGRILIGGYFTTVNGIARNYVARLNVDGTTDTSFNPRPNREVFAILVQPDGKILIGGQFETVGGVDRYYLARLSSTGAVDSLDPDPDWFVHTLALQPDGKILVGGEFSSMGTSARKCIARLNSTGSLDSAFNPGVTDPFSPAVRALAVQADGKILVGGQFERLGGLARANIGRLNANGTTDSAFNPGADYPVLTFSVRTDAKILVGGEFFTIGGESRSGKARLNADGSIDDLLFSAGPGSVFATAIDNDGRQLFGSIFGLTITETNGPVTNALNYAGTTATWSRGGEGPEVWSTVFDRSADGTSWTNIGVGSRIGGGWQRTNVSLPAGQMMRARGRVAGDSAGSGWFATAYYGRPFFLTHPISTTNQYLDYVFLSGTAAGSEPLSYWWLKDGQVVTNLPNSSGYANNTLMLGDAFGGLQGDYRLVVSNTFGVATSAVANVTVQDPIIIRRPGNVNLSLGITVQFSGMAVGTPPLFYQWLNNGIPIAGGTNETMSLRQVTLTNAGTVSFVASNMYGSVTSTPSIVTVNGAITDALFTSAANGSVNAMAVQGDGRIVLGGSFTSFRGEPQARIVRIHPDGTVDASFTGSVMSNGFVNCLTLQPDGRILVGGMFTNISGAARTNLARLNSDGTVDATFNALAGNNSSNDFVKSLVVQTDGKIVVGGYFVRLAGQVRTNLGRLNTNGLLDTAFTASAVGVLPLVETLALQPDGKILVGGRFNFLNGVRRSSIGRLLATGGLDTTFNPGANSNSNVRTLAVQADGMILAGGTFTQMGGQERNALARLNSSGTPDTNFDADLEMTSIGTLGVNSIAIQADGKILLGGTFTRFSGTTRNFFGRLTATGEPDVTFNVGFNGPVRGVTIQPDGKILVGQNGVFRINNTGPASETLDYIGSTISWMRSGTGPEVVHAFFEYSTNGLNWMNLGSATRVANGWQKTNVPVQPANGVLRARGYVRGSDNSGSGWFTEKYRGKPVILSQPVSRTNVVGTTAVFTVLAGGTEPLRYQWRRDGADLADGDKSSGAFSNVLTLTDVQVSDVAGFDVVVTNLSGSVTSRVANLSVLVLEGYNRITGAPLGGGLHLLQFVGQPGASYVLERTFNLAPPVNWIPQSTNQAAELGLLNFTNTAVGLTNNFWRVRLRP